MDTLGYNRMQFVLRKPPDQFPSVQAGEPGSPDHVLIFPPPTLTRLVALTKAIRMAPSLPLSAPSPGSGRVDGVARIAGVSTATAARCWAATACAANIAVVFGTAIGRAKDQRLPKPVAQRLQLVESGRVDQQLARPAAGDLSRREVRPGWVGIFSQKGRRCATASGGRRLGRCFGGAAVAGSRSGISRRALGRRTGATCPAR